MKASLCVGEYCENAYNVEGLDIRVYSMEELCYCLKENAFLLDLSIMNDKLVDWIGEECKVWELAKQLYPMVHKQGSLSVFVVTILQYVGMYDPEEILQVEQVLKQGAGLSNLEKRKSQIDYMVEKRKYAAASRGYDMLLETWNHLEQEGKELPAGKVRAAILHNKGVALTGLMFYDKERNDQCFIRFFRRWQRHDHEKPVKRTSGRIPLVYFCDYQTKTSGRRRWQRIFFQDKRRI